MQKRCLRLLAIGSSHRRCSNKKICSRKLAKSTGKHLWHSLFFNKIPSPSPGTLLRKRPWRKCFPFIEQFVRRSTFQQTEDILSLFLWPICCQSVRKKFLQKYGLFIQNKCRYKISSFNEKKNRHSSRLNNSGKTFLNHWGNMGFRKLRNRTPLGDCFWAVN